METPKPKLIIVDDDDDIVEVTKAFLKRRGFDVLSAPDGEKGLALIREEKPDLIILDVMLPGMSGYEVCNKIKEDKKLWHTPVIYFTAKGDFPDKITGLKSGADDYMTKPFEPEELLARIWMILNRTYNVLDANPLTKLPGNNAIQKQITHRLGNNEPFAIAHLDIDRFKSFNDEYGFERGDRAIHGLAQILVDITKEKGNAGDFIGHIGGDDFILISDPSHIDVLCREVIRSFDAMVPKLYNEKDQQRGFLLIKDRQGNLQEFPLMSLSIAVVTNEKRRLSHVGEVNAIAAELKKYVKSLPGSNYAKDRREQEISPKGTLRPQNLEETSQLLQGKKINLFLQPIVDTTQNTLQGYETMIRGMSNSRVFSQDELFNQAIELKMEKELGKIYFDKLKIFSYGIQKPLFILSWLNPRIFLTILESSSQPLKDLGCDPKLLMFQFKTSDLMRYDKALKEIIRKVEAEGASTSISLAWGAPTPLHLLSELKPKFLYLDLPFFDKIEQDTTQQTVLKMLSDMARILKNQLLVSGVTSQNQVEILKSYNVSIMSGPFFSEKTKTT